MLRTAVAAVDSCVMKISVLRKFIFVYEEATNGLNRLDLNVCVPSKFMLEVKFRIVKLRRGTFQKNELFRTFPHVLDPCPYLRGFWELPGPLTLLPLFPLYCVMIFQLGALMTPPTRHNQPEHLS